MVLAASSAPVGEYVRPFSVSALRCRYDRHGWSGKSPMLIHCRHDSLVFHILSAASSNVCGAGCPDQLSATKTLSPSVSRVRARASWPSRPMRRLVVSRSVGWASGSLLARAIASPYAAAEYSHVATLRW